MRLKLVIDEKITGLKQKLWIGCENLAHISDLEDYIRELTDFEGRVELLLDGFYVHHHFSVSEALKDSDEIFVLKSELGQEGVNVSQVIAGQKLRDKRKDEEDLMAKRNRKWDAGGIEDWHREKDSASQVKFTRDPGLERKKSTKQDKNLKKQMKKNPKMKEFSGTVTKFPKKSTTPNPPAQAPGKPAATATPNTASEPVSVLPHELKPGDQISFTLTSSPSTIVPFT